MHPQLGCWSNLIYLSPPCRLCVFMWSTRTGRCLQLPYRLVDSLPTIPGTRFLHHGWKLRWYLSPTEPIPIHKVVLVWSSGWGSGYVISGIWWSAPRICMDCCNYADHGMTYTGKLIYPWVDVGHYIPQLAKVIVDNNKVASLKINLKGYMVMTVTLLCWSSIRVHHMWLKFLFMCKLHELQLIWFQE